MTAAAGCKSDWQPANFVRGFGRPGPCPIVAFAIRHALLDDLASSHFPRYLLYQRVDPPTGPIPRVKLKIERWKKGGQVIFSLWALFLKTECTSWSHLPQAKNTNNLCRRDKSTNLQIPRGCKLRCARWKARKRSSQKDQNRKKKNKYSGRTTGVVASVEIEFRGCCVRSERERRSCRDHFNHFS